MSMKEIMDYLAGVSAIGIIAIVVWVVKWFLTFKTTLLTEIVDPAIAPLKKDIKALQDKVASLECNDKDLSQKLETQFNSLKESLAQTNQKLAQMQGSLDIIINRLEK